MKVRLWKSVETIRCAQHRVVVCRQHTYRVHDYSLMHSCCTDLFLPVVIVYSHTLTACTCMAQVTKHIVCVSPRSTHTSSRSVALPHLMTPSTDTPSSHVLHPPISLHKPCGDLRPQLSGALAEPRPFTGNEPKQLVENQDYKHFTRDGQLTEHEDLRVKPLSFHQSITASTDESAESIAAPLPESDLDDAQLRAPLASPLYLQEREASPERSQVYHSERENLMSSSPQDPISTGKPVALFSSKKWVESRNVFR